MSKFVNPGDVEIGRVMLHSLDGSKELNIIDQIRQIDIYEGLFHPTIYGELMMVDGIDIVNEFPIVGEERIEIEFRTKNRENFTRFNLFVSDVGNVTIQPNLKYKTYTLRLVSEEHLANQTFKVTRHFKTQSGNIVRELLSEMGTEKKIHIEQTKGIDDVLISQMYCFEAIDFIRKRAVSESNISSSFVFFENQEGFNFVTIEKLLDEGKHKIGDKVFFNDETGKQDMKSMQYRTVIHIQETTAASSIQKISNAQNNRVKTFDIFTGRISDFVYINAKDQFKYKFAQDAKPVRSFAFEEKYGRGLTKTLFVPKDSSKPENFIEEKVLYENPFIERLFQSVYEMNVWGDSSLKVGDVIDVTIPKGVNYDDSKTDRLKNGNFMISALRHNITLDQNRRYICAAQLVKGSYEDYV